MNQQLTQNTMNTAQDKIARLRQRFLQRIPEMLKQADALLAKLTAAPVDADNKQLHLLLHSIHGTSASFGFTKIASLAAEGEHMLVSNTLPDSLYHKLKELVQQLYALTEEQAESARRGGDSLVKFPIAASSQDEVAINRTIKPVYLCDDESEQAELLATQLRCFGFICYVFTNTADFTKAVISQPPSVVIMDVSFPEHAYGGPLAMSDLKKKVGTPFPVLYLPATAISMHASMPLKPGATAIMLSPPPPPI
ncbi:Hpt domain-containing protein [Buttiauxella agrestis]